MDDIIKSALARDKPVSAKRVQALVYELSAARRWALAWKRAAQSYRGSARLAGGAFKRAVHYRAELKKMRQEYDRLLRLWSALLAEKAKQSEELEETRRERDELRARVAPGG